MIWPLKNSESTVLTSSTLCFPVKTLLESASLLFLTPWFPSLLLQSTKPPLSLYNICLRVAPTTTLS